MIKENELRVGNLVYDDENIIMKVASIETKELNDWNGDSENTVIFQTLTEANHYKESVINPIPLTAKLIEQLGFKKDETTRSIYRIDEDKYLTISLDVYEFNKIHFPFAKTNHHEAGEHFSFYGIRYVHELQNFYFTLTKRELQYSKEISEIPIN